ncbi:homocysteine S-methyltransferase family protein [candidate division KSB1 bacterium]|nr:homocysteine S-methyltransferase family protein [candidate division KSB1 bacterium]
MQREKFRDRVLHNILILDGSMGTMLHAHIPAGACPDYTCITRPEVVARVHKEYVEAGADIILTNTFGATRLKLNEYGLGGKVNEINIQAAGLARQACRDNTIVAGSIGPTGQLVEPLGQAGFNEIYAVYKEQALALVQGGVDIFVLETFSDLKEAKAALMAVRENTDLPVMIAMTFMEDKKTFTGTDPVTAVTVLSSLGADAVGVNCSTGPKPMLEIVKQLTAATGLPVFVEPNAGIPKLNGSGATYNITPGEMAEYAELYVTHGANIVGACCGSTPEYTRLISQRLADKKPVKRTPPGGLGLSSRFSSVLIGPDLPFGVIGERINTTNRKSLAADIKDRQYILLKKDVESQVNAGARVIDLNISMPGIDESVTMREIVRNLDNTLKAPLCIDSKDIKAIETALRESAGKALINSVTGEVENMEELFPLAARYGAGLICLAIDERGIPDNAGDRVRIIEKILKRAEENGINRDNLIIDCLAMTVSTQQSGALETLKAIRAVKENLYLPTVLGVSNISYGLPGRSLLNSTYLSMAMAAGLDAAIMNPGDARMMDAVKAASVFTLRDKDAREYSQISFENEKMTFKGVTAEENRELNDIYNAVMTGNRESIGSLVKKALTNNLTAEQINNDALIAAIREVGLRYEKKELYLPQMMLSAEVFQAAFKQIQPHFKSSDVKSKGMVVLCTVRGDLHSIGKNIVRLLMSNAGYDVVDLGTDVPAETIYQKAEELKADVVGLSALMTTTMLEMENVVKLFREKKSAAKIIIGGAAVTNEFANDIGADGYAADGVGAVKLVDRLMGERE